MLSIRLRTWLLIFAVATTFVGLLGNTIWRRFDPSPSARLRRECAFLRVDVPNSIESVALASYGECGPLGTEGHETLRIVATPSAVREWIEAIDRAQEASWTDEKKSGVSDVNAFGATLGDAENSIAMQLTEAERPDGTYLFADCEQGIIEIVCVW